jgi:hypothetical protein
MVAQIVPGAFSFSRAGVAMLRSNSHGAIVEKNLLTDANNRATIL